jgi:hypothetical protein
MERNSPYFFAFSMVSLKEKFGSRNNPEKLPPAISELENPSKFSMPSDLKRNS